VAVETSLVKSIINVMPENITKVLV